MKLYCRLFLNLTHREQKKIISETVKRGEELTKNTNETFVTVEKMVDESFNKLDECTTDQEVLVLIVKVVSDLMNLFRQAIYERIEKLPASLYKKMHMAIFKDDIDLSFIVPLYLKEIEKKSNNVVDQLAEQCTMDELGDKLIQALVQGDQNSINIIQKAIKKKNENA